MKASHTCYLIKLSGTLFITILCCNDINTWFVVQINELHDSKVTSSAASIESISISMLEISRHLYRIIRYNNKHSLNKMMQTMTSSPSRKTAAPEAASTAASVTKRLQSELMSLMVFHLLNQTF
jgi:hypothetical protein